ncbi:MAG: DUF2064 domain-containing protein [Pseudomonadota bacterium]
MQIAVGVFAKTIGMSPVKTRLAKEIGTVKAEAFYQMSVAAIEAILSRLDSRFFPHWVLAEENSQVLNQWKKFPAIWTGDGTLGTRLANMHDRLLEDYDAVILIGTDSPQLNVQTFLTALDLLHDNPGKSIIGPAKDGGFYLFLSSQPIPREAWQKTSYSVETTLSELIDQQKKYGIASLKMDEEFDVDTRDELHLLQATFRQVSDKLLPEQKALLEWLDRNISLF